MKREFLQNLKIGEHALPKEIIDAIMAENGKDIQTVKARYADYDALSRELDQAKQSLAQLDAVRREAQQWEQKYQQEAQSRALQHRQLVFDHALEMAVTSAGGRNLKAITALLDVQALSESEDPRQATEQAVQSLRAECGYLFDMPQTPPPYARGTGLQEQDRTDSPASLAGALREKYERN